MSTIRVVIGIAWVAITLVTSGRAQGPPDSPSWRLMRAAEAEQIEAINSALDKGAPPELVDHITLLLLNKGSLVLPLIEKKIEQVLKATSPLDCFIDKNVDPQRFVDLMGATIAWTGDGEALKQISKLIKLDEKRFGGLVERTLGSARDYAKSRNPFVVAYRGFAIGDPAIDQRIVAWAESRLSPDDRDPEREVASRRLGIPPAPPLSAEMKRMWAEAMLDQYGGVPTELQWLRDPLASRLKVALSQTLHTEVFTLARDAWQKRLSK